MYFKWCFMALNYRDGSKNMMFWVSFRSNLVLNIALVTYDLVPYLWPSWVLRTIKMLVIILEVLLPYDQSSVPLQLLRTVCIEKLN